MSNRYDEDDFDRNVMDRNVSSRRYRANINDRNINERDVNDYGQRNLTNRSDFTSSRYGNQSRYVNDEPMSGYFDDYGRDTETNRSNRIDQGINQGYNRERELGRYSQNINRESNYGRSGYGYNQGFGQGYRQDYPQSSSQYYGQSYNRDYGYDMRDVGNVGDVNRGYSSGYRREIDDRGPDYSREYQNFGGRDLNRDYSPRLSNTGNINRNVGPHIGRGPKGYQRSDERIREEICEVLWRHDMIDASDIDVNVVNGEVTLTGTVESRLTKRLAEDVVEDINGVRDVHNQLKVNREDRYRQQYNTQSNVLGSPTTSTQTGEQTTTDKTNINTQTRATGAK